jgi:DNA polymerase III sliding clamp (beta) subunit (PCNA family)
MLEALKFVQGAVAKKDYQPALSHFRIANGTVKGYNGIIALCSPIDLDLQATPKAIPFVKAIERCEHETTVIHRTTVGRLSLRSGKFRAYIECHEEEETILDSIEPEGAEVTFPTNLLDALRHLDPFVGNDASRPWCNGVLLRGQSGYATNNIIVAEYWLGQTTPHEVNLPQVALRELIRIGTTPERVQVGENSVTFHYPNGRWMRTQLLDPNWPPIENILEAVNGTLLPFPPDLLAAVENLIPFIGDSGRVYLRGDSVSTSPNRLQQAPAALSLPWRPVAWCDTGNGG